MRALILVDIQNDFMPFGALPVVDGDAVVSIANELARRSSLVIATQDWHPADHGSFARMHPTLKPGDVVDLGGVEQVLWPDHCVQGTPGASFHSALDVARIDHVVRKGTDPGVDSYSGFYDNDRRLDTGLGEYLMSRGVDEVVICGLATDYCVKYTVLDAVGLGFGVTVVEDACRAVELRPGDGDRALFEMHAAGARVLESSELT
ncbi:MAG: bifunctional nicotinamidase/pyrazinamidase [Coriobacteriia bacterium]|nr:bifunctional nicotinamidase/pyrazinamidase [Coriobacteriia bacterium]MBN2823584.1 bifunctional nicotinamidase/pyrazinamidase [Coriobacteriia bacterium]